MEDLPDNEVLLETVIARLKEERGKFDYARAMVLQYTEAALAALKTPQKPDA